ncbi:hypothetical protein EI555_020156, partial [Monodon monoceros]
PCFRSRAPSSRRDPRVGGNRQRALGAFSATWVRVPVGSGAAALEDAVGVALGRVGHVPDARGSLRRNAKLRSYAQRHSGIGAQLPGRLLLLGNMAQMYRRPQLGNLFQVNQTLAQHVPLASQLILMPIRAVAVVQQERLSAQAAGGHNGRSKTFSHLHSNFSIPQANLSHSGEYHCTGFIGHTVHSSQPVTITVQGGNSVQMKGGEKRGSSLSNSLLVTITVAVVAWIAAMAVAGAIVAWFCLRRKKISGTLEHREMGETLPEEPANLTDAEEAAKMEAENTVTYSLLSYPEVAEEETESPDYQNHI